MGDGIENFGTDPKRRSCTHSARLFSFFFTSKLRECISCYLSRNPFGIFNPKTFSSSRLDFRSDIQCHTFLSTRGNDKVIFFFSLSMCFFLKWSYKTTFIVGWTIAWLFWNGCKVWPLILLMACEIVLQVNVRNEVFFFLMFRELENLTHL